MLHCIYYMYTSLLWESNTNHLHRIPINYLLHTSCYVHQNVIQHRWHGPPYIFSQPWPKLFIHWNYIHLYSSLIWCLKVNSQSMSHLAVLAECAFKNDVIYCFPHYSIFSILGTWLGENSVDIIQLLCDLFWFWQWKSVNSLAYYCR